MKTKNIPPSAAHVACRDAVVAAIKQHADNLRPDEMLAIAAHLVGQLIAMQDQRTMTSDLAMQLVMQNIEQGNAEIVQGLLAATGGNA